MTSPVVSFSNVTKRFGDIEALDSLSFSILPGEIYGLLGPNGSGKTTSLRILMNIFMQDSGSVSVLDGDPREESQLKIGYLPEERGLYPETKVEDQIKFFAGIKGMSPDKIEQKSRQWLERFDMWERRNDKAKELSKGLQQKIQFIITVIHEPELIILDEPFSGLDPVNTELLKSIINELYEKGRTIVFSTHMMEQVENICERICLISGGKKLIEGDLDKIKSEFGKSVIRVEGDTTELTGLQKADPVTGIEKRENSIDLYVKSGISVKDIFRLIDNKDALKGIREILPSLRKVFIDLVENENE